MMPKALPFFMKADPGERFCLYHKPDPEQPPRGVIVYASPFGEELNKTRRMAALQARTFAAAGFGVLQPDLYGCGDSSGDFGDARWQVWRHDLLKACEWLLSRHAGPLHLWGLRLGALLAIDYTAAALDPPESLILWQPVISGEAHLRQFLRVQTAANMLSRQAISDEMEVGGYRISLQLQDDLRAADAFQLRPRCPIFWIEQNSAVPAELSSASCRLLERWRHAGTRIETAAVQGAAFWASAEIEECPAFLSATAGMLALASTHHEQ